MKILRKLLLIHWHYFNHELIEFGQLNFLTGKNASGKSTIIDALQLILLGDTSGSFFNKAASGRGNRTLKGYLMGELGDDEDSGFRYLRNGRFTSYIALEFCDKEKKKAFTVGCCFDTYSENDTQKLFFLYNGEMHNHGFLRGNTPMDTTQRSNERLYSYLIDRASADMKSAELNSALAGAKKVAGQLAALKTKIADAVIRLAKLREQRDTLKAKLLNDSAAQALDTIDRQIAEKEVQICTLQTEYEKTLGILSSRISAWRKHTEAMLQKVESAKTVLMHPGVASRISDIYAEGRTFLESSGCLLNMDAAAVVQVGEAGLADYSAAADNLKRHSIELATHLRDAQETLAKQRAELMAEQQSLEKGIYRFPQDALELKAAVISRLRIIAKQDVNVRIVAEAAEIKNDRWRNVIEGYLNTQKFYIIVPQEYFTAALRVYDSIKRQQAIYGTGIVDIEKLKRLNPMADTGSLAEEIETDDSDVKVFLDYTLGRVQKCESVGELRRFRTSVTYEGMLYQNFVARAMNPERWAKPAIGQGAIQRRLDAVKREISVLTERVTVCAGIKIGLDYTNGLTLLSNTEIEYAVSAARNVSSIPALELDLSTLRKSREAIDTSAIDSLKNRIATLDKSVLEQDQLLRQNSENSGKLEETLRRLQDETIPHLTAELKEKEADITAGYSEDWIRETGAPRYERELSSRKKADHIADAFPRERSRAKNAKDDAWEKIVELRRIYNKEYKMGFDIKAESNDVYDDAWLELTDNKLPDYLTRITDARSKAFEQFQEDFLSRLQNNINNARRQIDDINSAIKGAYFGEDEFRFRMIPKPEYKRYYDMIVDEMLLQGGYNLLSGQFNAKYKEEIEDLFAIITNEDGVGGSQGSSEYEKRVHEFTDYRTYLVFDLEVVGPDGVPQRLSKTLGKKSGGETQTPFYIAVLPLSLNYTALEEKKAIGHPGLLFLTRPFLKWMVNESSEVLNCCGSLSFKSFYPPRLIK